MIGALLSRLAAFGRRERHELSRPRSHLAGFTVRAAPASGTGPLKDLPHHSPEYIGRRQGDARQRDDILPTVHVQSHGERPPRPRPPRRAVMPAPLTLSGSGGSGSRGRPRATSTCSAVTAS